MLRQTTPRKLGVSVMYLVFLGLTLGPSPVRAEQCVASPTEIHKYPKLQELTMLVAPDGEQGFVNETQGTYLVIDTRGSKILATIYTSGLFDLVAIRRAYEITLCEDGGQAFILIGSVRRRETIRQEDQFLVIGDNGAKGTFRMGEMPEALRKMHGKVSR